MQRNRKNTKEYKKYTEKQKTTIFIQRTFPKGPRQFSLRWVMLRVDAELMRQHEHYRLKSEDESEQTILFSKISKGTVCQSYEERRLCFIIKL